MAGDVAGRRLAGRRGKRRGGGAMSVLSGYGAVEVCFKRRLRKRVLCLVRIMRCVTLAALVVHGDPPILSFATQARVMKLLDDDDCVPST
jgi:hypothetical protein